MKKTIITFVTLFLTLNIYGATSVSQALSYLRGNMDATSSATEEPTGFESPDLVDVSYSAANRTITLTQTDGIVYWWKGTRYTLESPWTSPAHDTGNSLYYLAARTSTNFEWSTSPWTFNMAQAAYVKYGGVKLGFRECHGLLQWQAHEDLHRNIGSYRVSGGYPDPTTYTLNTSSDAANTPGFNVAIVDDEDLATTINAWTEGKYSLLYFASTNTAIIETNSATMFKNYGSYPMVNTFSTTFTTNTVTVANRFLNYYQMLIPVASDSVSQEYRTLILQPQFAYASKVAALAEDFRSLNLGEFVNIAAEFITFTRFTVDTANAYATTGKVRIQDVTFLTGSKATQVSVSQLVLNSTASSISVDTTGFTNKLSSEDITVQKALNTLDQDSGQTFYVLATTNLSLSPNRAYYANVANSTNTISFTTNGLVNGKASGIILQMDYTNTASILWPATTIMQWQSGVTPTLKNGRNFLYFDKMLTNDIWRGFAQ